MGVAFRYVLLIVFPERYRIVKPFWIRYLHVAFVQVSELVLLAKKLKGKIQNYKARNFIKPRLPHKHFCENLVTIYMIFYISIYTQHNKNK